MSSIKSNTSSGSNTQAGARLKREQHSSASNTQASAGRSCFFFMSFCSLISTLGSSMKFILSLSPSRRICSPLKCMLLSRLDAGMWLS